MIYLYQEQDNTVVVTLNEKATNSTFDALFEFTNEVSGEVFKVASNDTSTVDRYNKYNIRESVSQNIVYGRINLEAGQYKYVIYEMPVLSPPSTDSTLSRGVLERGRATVFEADSRDEFTDNEDKDSPTFE